MAHGEFARESEFNGRLAQLGQFQSALVPAGLILTCVVIASYLGEGDRRVRLALLQPSKLLFYRESCAIPPKSLDRATREK